MATLCATWIALAVCATPLASQVQVLASSPDVSDPTKRAVESMAQEGILRLSPYFPGTPTRKIRIVVHADSARLHPSLRESLHPGVPGFARLQLDEIHLVLGDIGVDPPNDLQTTVDHELVHILLDQFVGKNGLHVARWFHEGLAQDLAGGGYLGVHEEDLVYRVHTRTYIPFRELERGFPRQSPERLALAYGQSYSFVSFLRREVGLENLLAAAKKCGPDRRFRAALAMRMHQGLVVYENAWLDYILKESGAGFRVILRNCFLILLLLLAGPLLALAVARRRNREERIKRRMGAEDQAEDAAVVAAEALARAELERTDEEPRFRAEFDDESAGEFDDEFDDEDVDWDDWRVDPDDPEYEGRDEHESEEKEK